MSYYLSFARDLRALAAQLEILNPDLPLVRYPDSGITVTIHVPEALDVLSAAQALDTPVKVRHEHTTTVTHIGDTVHLEFVHISDAEMTRYSQRQALLAKVASS